MSAHQVTRAEYIASADPERCALCGGALQILGALGSYTHYRCRDCGAESHGQFSPAQQERIARLRAQFFAESNKGES